jgi:DNA-binding GntR family transcriptional regulator
LRLLDGEPHSVTHNAQRPELGSRHTKKSLTNLPMATILEKVGIPLAYFTRRISAVSSPSFVAEHLNITLGTPTLLYTCTLHGQDRSIIEWIRIYLRPGVSPPPETFDLKERARLYQSGL